MRPNSTSSNYDPLEHPYEVITPFSSVPSVIGYRRGVSSAIPEEVRPYLALESQISC
jgi:hypothetical protein